jgi:hypothetical protein
MFSFLRYFQERNCESCLQGGGCAWRLCRGFPRILWGGFREFNLSNSSLLNIQQKIKTYKIIYTLQQLGDSHNGRKKSFEKIIKIIETTI